MTNAEFDDLVRTVGPERAAAKKAEEREALRAWHIRAAKAQHAEKTPEERAAFGRALVGKRWEKARKAKAEAAAKVSS